MNIVDWCTNLIDSYREKLTTINYHIEGVIDLSEPVQVVVIQCYHSKLFFLIFFKGLYVTDKRIDSIEAYNDAELVIKLKELFNSKYGNVEISEHEHLFYNYQQSDNKIKNVISPVLYDIVCKSKSNFRVNIKIENVILRRKPLGSSIFIWEGYGEINKLDVENMVNDMIPPYNSDIKNENQEKIMSVPKIQITGFFGVWFPKVWIGEIPFFNVDDMIEGNNVIPFSDLVYKRKLFGKDVFINREGLIFIEEDDKKKANEIINNIMAFCILYGTKVIPVREYEMGFAIVNDDGRFDSYSIENESQRNKEIGTDDFYRKESPESLRLFRQLINEDTIRFIIDNYEILLSKLPKGFLKFLSESYSHYLQEEYNQAFILAFLIIEAYISKLWDNQLDKWDISKKRRNDSFGYSNWNLSNSMEFLEIEKVISTEEYNVLLELRRKRNRLVHNMSEIREEDAKKCLNISMNIVSKIVGFDVGILNYI